MKFAIDRIEEDIAVCENLETKELIEINIKYLPNNIKDGAIIVLKEDKYELDSIEEKRRRNRIRERFNRLKNK